LIYAAVGAVFGAGMMLSAILVFDRPALPSIVGWALGGVLVALLAREADLRRRRRR